MSRKKLVRHYEALLARDPTDLLLLQKLGEACQQAGDELGAANAFARVAAVYERDGFFLKAVALLKQALKLDPSLNGVRIRLVGLHLRLGLVGEAVALLRAALSAANSEHDLEACFNVSMKLVEVDHARPEFRIYLAQLLLWANRKEQAREQLAAAAKLLESRTPDLAEKALGLLSGPDLDVSESDLVAVRELRLEFYAHDSLEHGLRRLDFRLPN